MTDRGVSTVVDVTALLLLVTAAVGLLVVPLSPTMPVPTADASATVVVTTTAEIEYALALGDETGPEFRRVRHGTLAALLARAAVGDATIAGVSVSTATDDFERRVADATANATGERVHVRARWRAYRGSDVAGTVRAGRPPPADAVVGAATITVPSGLPAARTRALAAANRTGYAGIATVVAASVVAGLFPPDSTRLALAGDHPVDALADGRYRRVAAAVGTRVDGPLADRDTARANERLADALAARVETDLRERFDTPIDAAQTVTVGEVELVVRRWTR